jgi:hypothetical protein
MGKFAGILAVIAGIAGIFLGVLLLLTSPIGLLLIGITALALIWEKWGPKVVEITTGLQVLTGILVDSLIKALADLVKKIRMGVIYQFGRFKAWLLILKGKILDWKANVLDPLVAGVVSLWTGLKDAVTWFGNLWEKIKEMGGKVWDAIKIFLGRSPSPLEKGLRGVADQMKQMSKFDIPSFSSALAGMPALTVAPMAAGGGIGDTINNWTMEVNTRAETSTVLQDWETLRYLAPR